jgi:hypothetical protein
MRTSIRWVAVSAVLLSWPSPAGAQNWSFDARTIALGGVGSTSNVAYDMVDQQRPYRAIVLPLGLIQVLPNLPKLNPTEDDFDLIRAIEYAASPIHYVFGRDDTDTGSQFITDIRNGELSRDLNAYRGFVPSSSVSAEGLASPSWGATIKFQDSGSGPFQGIYIGAGPYLGMQTSATVDPALISVLASATPVYVPNTSFYMSNDTVGQTALAVTGGYRARFAWPSGVGGGGATEGLYIGANYHYLRGFQYEHVEPDARLDTNAQGLLTVNPALGFPVRIIRNSSRSGNGFAIDMGVAAVMNGWEVGFGVNGIANRIDWTSVERTDYVLDNLFSGGEFQDFPTVPVPDVRAELPVDVRANGGYNADAWSAIAEYGHGYNGTTFRGGIEQRLAQVQLRVGSRYIKERWEPTFGAGFNFSDRAGIDAALFGTSANVERKRHWALAVSFRLMTQQNP